MSALLALDQGTTSTRAILFDRDGHKLAMAQRELRQYFPQDGWVEHEPEEIWQASLAVCRQVIEQAGLNAQDILAMGITNQRETTLLWDKASGRALHRAIVWQDRRTAARCAELKADGWESVIQARTGLLLDPYFSATKLEWLLDHIPQARERAERGELAFGTVDSWLLWNLSGAQVHATDASNASRTMLFDIERQVWDEELLALFRIPAALLPQVCDSSHLYGRTHADHLGAPIPIAGIAGDQQAALLGQACFAPGMVKSTYGTGCFMMMNTGSQRLHSHNRLLSTVAYRLQGRCTYALEGSIFVAGAAVQWLRDGLQLIAHASETERIATEAGEAKGVYLVPAFTGLGAPYWDPHARGAILGLTRDTGIGEIVTAGLQSVGFQTRDLVEAMRRDGAADFTALRVDGGMVVNNWLLQSLADLTGVPVDRPQVTETTALGAAYLAGLAVDAWPGLATLSQLWRCDRHVEPAMPAEQRESLYAGWMEAVGRVASR